MRIRTEELSGPALDWAVAKAEGRIDLAGLSYSHAVLMRGRLLSECNENGDSVTYSPSTDWSQGGPIIEREQIYLHPTGDANKWQCYVWNATPDAGGFSHRHYGPTPLVAAMRCFVKNKLGDEVEVPDELA